MLISLTLYLNDILIKLLTKNQIREHEFTYFSELDISKNEPEITKKLIEIFNNWPKGSNRSLSVIESLMDPDTFGGKEDRLPYVEQAFINAEESID